MEEPPEYQINQVIVDRKLIPDYLYSTYCKTLAHQKAGSYTGEKRTKIRESRIKYCVKLSFTH